jgi:lactate dehydrogenase-like 2-hydroxyacid dehydrogenase
MPAQPCLILAFEATPEVMKKLRQHFHVIQGKNASMTTDEIVALANEHQASAILVSVNHKLLGETMRALPSTVKIIATSSVGFDHLDRAVAKEKGIILTHTPDVLSDCTADLAILLMMNVSRRAKEYGSIMESGWPRMFGQSEMLGLNFKGKTLGILGMGSIGREVAIRARAFGMKILYCNRHRLSPELEMGATYFDDFKKMLPLSDVISLHAPATNETRNIINSETLALMKKNAILINVARGSLVDEEALIAALESEHLFGAGLDVFQKEPDFDRRFLKFKNVFLTPHMGSATVETRNAMGFLAAENILAVLAGKSPITEIQSETKSGLLPS